MVRGTQMEVGGSLEEIDSMGLGREEMWLKQVIC